MSKSTTGGLHIQLNHHTKVKYRKNDQFTKTLSIQAINNLTPCERREEKEKTYLFIKPYNITLRQYVSESGVVVHYSVNIGS
jgi:hypothetical protein